MYRYVSKEDKDALHFRNHSDLSDNAPRTEQAISCRKVDKWEEKEKILNVYDVCEMPNCGSQEIAQSAETPIALQISVRSGL